MSKGTDQLRQQIHDISLYPIKLINNGVVNPPGLWGLTDEQLNQIMQLIEQRELEARIDAANYFRNYMISTSPFISRILDPYIEEQQDRLAHLRNNLSKEKT